jgi:uncharacterized protein YndB with AHSA1/START domain
MTANSQTIHVDQFIASPPEKVWEALVDPERLVYSFAG